MTPSIRDKLLRVGARAIVTQLAKHNVRGRDIARLPQHEPFAG